jgi:septal ring factor EnvC (AmiA/AmiB activator)
MGFITSKLFLLSVGALVVLVTIFGIYFKISQDQIEALTANLAKTEVAIDLQKQAIDDMKLIAESQKQSIEEMQTQISKAESDRAALATQIRNLNIVQNAQTNRPQLQTNMNTQLNDLFSSVNGGTVNAKKPQ